MYDEGDSSNKGRPLKVASLTIIAYVIAHGSVAPTGTAGFVFVKFERPEALEIFGLTLFAYFVVRFLTPTWDVLARSKLAGRKYLASDPQFRKKVKEVGDRQHPNKDTQFGNSMSEGRTNQHKLALWMEDGQLVVPVQGLIESPHSNRNKAIPVQLREVFPMMAKAGIKTLIFSDECREDIWPLILATVAGILVLVRFFTGW